MSETTDRNLDIRQQAVNRLKKRREFRGHLLAYALINASLIVVWAMTTGGGIFWPLFPLLGWGIGVALHAYDVYFVEDFDDEDIRREIARIQQRR